MLQFRGVIKCIQEQGGEYIAALFLLRYIKSPENQG